MGFRKIETVYVCDECGQSITVKVDVYGKDINDYLSEHMSMHFMVKALESTRSKRREITGRLGE